MTLFVKGSLVNDMVNALNCYLRGHCSILFYSYSTNFYLGIVYFWSFKKLQALIISWFIHV